MKPLNLIVFLLVLGSDLFAQSCVVSQRVQQAKSFFVDMERTHYPADSTILTFISFKHPATSDEIINSQLVQCKGWLPEGASIDIVEIKSISGLPGGSKWYCTQPGCRWKGGKTGCIKLRIKTPSQKGTYPILINTKGRGSLWGVNRWYNCQLKFEAVVE